jgi:F-type H+-transporting ATPase subunit delta
MSELTPEVKQYLEHDVGAVAVARVYAEALLNQAALQHQEQETLDDLEALLNQVFQAHPDLEEFLTGDAVGRESKGKVIEAAFANRCSELLSNFLHVLNDHDRLPLIRPIIYLYRTTLDKRRGRMRVVVRSAVPLVDHQRERLQTELRQVFKREPLLEELVEPDLLGGLVVRVGDWLYDASVRTRLNLLQDEIIERSSHEIQSGRDRFRTG